MSTEHVESENLPDVREYMIGRAWDRAPVAILPEQDGSWRDVTMGDHLIPGLRALHLTDGRIRLTIGTGTCDMTQDAWEAFAPFIADCIAWGMGYVGFPRGNPPALRSSNPFPAVHFITSMEPAR